MIVSIIIPVRNESALADHLIRLRDAVETRAAIHRQDAHTDTGADNHVSPHLSSVPRRPTAHGDNPAPECEIIVVDGASSDDCVAQLTAAGLHVISATAGRAKQMNAGAAAARGDVLLFLHADTHMPPRALTDISNAVRAGRSWGRFDVSIEGKSLWLPIVALFMNVRSRLTGIATGDQAIFVRKAVFDAVGGFEDVPLMEDIRLSKRLLQNNKPVCLRAKVRTSGRRWDTSGPVRVIVLMWLMRYGHWRQVPPETLATLYRKDICLRHAAAVCLGFPKRPATASPS